DLLGERAVPCSQEGVSHGVPPCNHIAAGSEELRLSGACLEASVMELLGNTLDALTEISGIAPERCAMDAVLETRPGLAPHCTRLAAVRPAALRILRTDVVAQRFADPEHGQHLLPPGHRLAGVLLQQAGHRVQISADRRELPHSRLK